MALTKARALFNLKTCQFFSETFSSNKRMLPPFSSRASSSRNFSTATDEKNDSAQQHNGSTSPLEIDPRMKEELDSLKKENTELKQKCGEINDKYKRALADSENMRVSLNNQIADAKLFGIQSFCKDLLDVADVLGRAVEAVPKKEVESGSSLHLKSLYEGVLTMEAQLKNVFKRHGLEAVDPIDEQFNPHYHEALFHQDIEGKKAGSVVLVTKIGYKLHDRVIRPALVGVAK